MRRDATVLSGPRRALVLCGCVLVSTAAEAGAAIPASERAALIALYDSTDGAHWCPHTGWRNATDTDFAAPGTECTWHGVTCDASGSHVDDLVFLDNCLHGSIPPEIGNLTRLSALILWDYGLDGSIPREIGNVTNLRHLDLVGSLSGAIPSEIGNLTNLEDLYLAAGYGNHLTGSIPPEIGNPTNLRWLSLQGNQLSGPLPREIGNLASLSSLDLSRNQLSGPIPPEIGSLTSLRELYLDRNQLTGPIPSGIGNLVHVSRLSLDDNQLSGPIPPGIGEIGVDRFPEDLLLRLDHNQLSGPIPPEIGNLVMGTVTEPGTLRLDHNQLSGPIPAEIGKLRWMDEFRLDHNQLSGPIPPEIGNMGMVDGNTSTTHLHLDQNQLSGPIPPEIARLASARHLLLNDNQLTGRIPPEIGNVPYLEELDLGDNRLRGPIPSRVGNLHRLSWLRLNGNYLTGSIPAALMSLTGLINGGSDLRWNALYTSDAALRAFLDAKQEGGDWESTQTVAPAGLAAGSATVGSVPLSWSPIPYTGDTGGYRIWYGTRQGGPYSLGGTTADKAVSAATVSGLSPGTTYHFALDTVTEPHASNQNTVVSERSVEVSATTAPGGVGWHALTVVTYGLGSVSSSPAAIACGGACSATFAPGTAVTLTAAPDPESSFLGWGGACAGTALTCELTMDSARWVTATFSTPALSYYTVTPCRVFDSRNPGLGGPVALAAGTSNPVQVAGYCSVPATAKAVSLNVTVVAPSAGGHLRLFGLGTPRPTTSSINYASGQTRANDAVVAVGADGALTVYVNQPSGSVHVVLDVNGYFQ
jgi:Leucine-rich repeat (LRR) protein